MLCISSSSVSTPLSGEDIEPEPGVRAGRPAEATGGLAEGARLVLDTGVFFGRTDPATEGRGRCVVADLTDEVESGEATDARGGTAVLAGAEGAVDEDSLPDVDADRVPDRAGGPVALPGASDVLRVGAGAGGVAADCLGGMVVFEDGAEMDFFNTMGLEEGAGF